METIVETAVARQEDAAGVGIDVDGVEETVGGTIVARRRIAATLLGLPALKVGVVDISEEDGRRKSEHVPGPLPAIAPV